ncbi:MAG TPA: TetR/AcrR family transcriptional regulator [Hyphomicrobium sp.]|jgi:AcrR family transcriptional regulator|uniref:TetR/AcrR family transcriptional regulator n=1 Tax=Hyphomicrobium sp. TaxID=82 RepID=UPI002B7195B1|nr:TetR/AcrR family transcriptional regulator [Hyphomicrobium sp.]HXE01092.1 TetR/AcrR family transcriptional regulator [Hyphomicrobium sp.]
MGRRSVHSPEELRQLILDASQTIVERSGITGLSAREIARMIGYSPGTLYNIFENLDDILVTLQVQLQARTVEHLKHVPMGSDGEKNIEALTQAYVDFALANRRMWNLFLAHSLPPGSTMPEPFHDNINKIFSIIRTAVAPLAPNTPREKLEAMAWALWTGIHGITAVAATEKGVYVTPVTAQSYAKDLAITFVKGLREH